tara:strand:+ start:1057 stop:1473 length:417 start_codon:yes stop_codon:yes gene_type:complete
MAHPLEFIVHYALGVQNVETDDIGRNLFGALYVLGSADSIDDAMSAIKLDNLLEAGEQMIHANFKFRMLVGYSPDGGCKAESKAEQLEFDRWKADFALAMLCSPDNYEMVDSPAMLNELWFDFRRHEPISVTVGLYTK